MKNSHSNIQRILALDFGQKRIGLAVSDPFGSFAQPLPFILNRSWPRLAQELKKVIEEKTVELVVVGLPKRTDESIGPEAQKVIEFAKAVQKECGVEVQLYDESYSTREAEEILIQEFDLSRKKRKQIKDSLSACLILNSYLRAKQNQ